MPFINQAYAQEVPNLESPSTVSDTNTVSIGHTEPAIMPEPPKQSVIGSLLPLILVFLILYMLVLRPQQKKFKAHVKLLRELKRGDKVITSGGIIGTIVKINEENNTVDITITKDKEIVITVIKNNISELTDNK